MFANNKGTDQPAHQRSLVRAFVICSSESILGLATNSIFEIVSVAAQGGLNRTLSETPKTGFYVSRLILVHVLDLFCVLFILVSFVKLSQIL